MTGKVLTVAQQKGGAGKSTLAANLAVAFTDARKSVAIIDIDPQESLTTWFRTREAMFGEDVSGIALSQIKGWRARSEIERFAEGYDIVIIDTPPHAETEARIAIRAADLVVVPVQPSPMDIWATQPTLKLAERERVPAVVVLTRVPARSRLTDDMLPEIKSLGAKLTRTRLGNRVVFAAAMVEGLAAGEVQPWSPAAKEVAALAREIARKLK